MTSLIRTQLIVTFALNSLWHPRKRLKSLGLFALIAVCVAPGYAGYIALLHKAFSALAAGGAPLQDMLVTGVYSMAQLSIVLVGVPIVYAGLFQSNDLSILLPLPLRPHRILAAKLAVIYVVELVIAAGFFLPAVVIYGMVGPEGLSGIANGAVALLLLPVVPLGISTIASILIVNIPGIGRSRWFWYLAMMVAVMAGSLSYSALTSIAATGEVATLMQAKMQQLNNMGRLLPGSLAALRALASHGSHAWGYQALNLLVAAAYVAGTLAVGQWLYVRPMLRGGGGGSRAHRRAQAARVRGFIASYARKEAAATLKDPAVAMNAIGGYIALPLLAVTYGLMKSTTNGKVDVIGGLLKAIHSPAFREFLPYVVVGFALSLAFLGNGSSLFSASYSKDGRRLWIEKTLPVAAFDVMLGKLLMGMVLVTGLNLLTIGLASLAVPLSVWQWVYVAVLSEVVLAQGGLIGLSIDCVRPKLVWKDTVQAVKQNLNVVLSFAVSVPLMALQALLLWCCHNAGASDVLVYSGVLVLNLAILGGAAAAARRAASGLERAAW